MACASKDCQSGCFRDEEDSDVTEKQKLSDGTCSGSKDPNLPNLHNLCLKCKVNETLASSGAVSGDLDISRFCFDCFRGNLFGKFKLAVTSNAMISPTDNVLVAFSGGPSSRVALQFVHELQHKSQKNLDASPDRSLPVFGVGVAFVDESAVSGIPSDEFVKAIQDMQSIVSNLAPPEKAMHVALIESIYSSNGRDRLKALLNAVQDVTGKEDLLQHLRMLLLQKIAHENRYTKLILGSCTSRIACHVISATVKGQGYSLPGDIQYVDARWEVPVVLPLRDCLAHELSMLCHLDGLKTVEVLNSPHSGINGLVASFVTLLQEENPSRECTIVRTAAKLTPFHFNWIQESNESNARLAQRRQKKFNLKPYNESIPPVSYCAMCNSPLSKSDEINWSSLESNQTDADIFRATCCASCQFQILPKKPSSMGHFYSILPQQFAVRTKDRSSSMQRQLREQIQDFLLSDDEDGILNPNS